MSIFTLTTNSGNSYSVGDVIAINAVNYTIDSIEKLASGSNDGALFDSLALKDSSGFIFMEINSSLVEDLRNIP